MKRFKRDRVKVEKSESSSGLGAAAAEHDLAHYIHDRVALMQQVFSALKPRDLRAMAPGAARALPLPHLQELCTEELLGISSKRLLAVLDGAEPPTDTESSGSEPQETISLDSISSDDELLSQHSKKKKHKHKRRDSKSKSKKRDKPRKLSEAEAEAGAGGQVGAEAGAGAASRASRAGLTVLELLELQARARAIRAQLHNDHALKGLPAAAPPDEAGDEDEVQIKEEEPDVVEISSEDEKPDPRLLRARAEQPSPAEPAQKPPPCEEAPSTNTDRPTDVPTPQHTDKQTDTRTVADVPRLTSVAADERTDRQTVTRRVSDLIITVPQTKTTRKIKLNRNKVTVTVPNVPLADDAAPQGDRTVTIVETKVPDKAKKKQKKSRKKKNKDKEGSDHDEITLQLSDSEKMDLLEDLNEKNYEKLSSSSDSDSSGSGTDTEIRTDNKRAAGAVEDRVEIAAVQQIVAHDTGDSNEVAASGDAENVNKITESEVVTVENIDTHEDRQADNVKESVAVQIINETSVPANDSEVQTESVVENSKNNDQNSNFIESQEPEDISTHDKISNDEAPEPISNAKSGEEEKESDKQRDSKSEHVIEITTIEDIPVITEEKEMEQPAAGTTTCEKEISEGELSDRESSEVEAFDIEPEVVCISDEEKKTKKKKKKDKKSKKEKKSKKSSKKEDFRERADENFYRDVDKLSQVETTDNTVDDDSDRAVDVTDDDDVYEILELSDDSSCYEVGGTVLSQEPTADEIEALSAAIDAIRGALVRNHGLDDNTEHNDEQMLHYEHTKTDDDSEQDTEYISWKDRYLGSNKVKKVLTTANILNALRKKNKELKKKIQDAKTKEREEKESEEAEIVPEPEEPVEGSIEHYKTLQASTKYVDPVQEPVIEPTDNKEGNETSKEDGATNTDANEVAKITTQMNEKVTKGMKKDAKQLLKMYKKLLKYNDMDKQRDPSKKEQSKKKKKKQSADVDTPRL